jgi:hypothetical protein
MEEVRRGHSIKIETVETLFSSEPLSELRDKLSASDHSAPQFESLSVEPNKSKEVLIIDGEIIPYVEAKDGYRVYYQPAAKSLIEAARSFVDTQPEVKE